MCSKTMTDGPLLMFNAKKTVCGLHVENNLRVIPEFANKQKGNRHV